MDINCNFKNPPLGGLITAFYLKTTESSISINWNENNNYIKTGENIIHCDSVNDLLISRALARLYSKYSLYGDSVLDKTEVDSWLLFSNGPLNSTSSEFSNSILHLNQVLGPVTFLVSKKLTIADFHIFSTLYGSPHFKKLLENDTVPVNVLRWYNQLLSFEFVKEALKSLPKEARNVLTLKQSKVRRSLSPNVQKSNTKMANESAGDLDYKQEGKFVDLPGAEMGKVVVRFPPEASGYLHIGHAKAALLNQYYQQAFQGKLIMRFDDTNPAKENVEFEEKILEDVAMLQIKPDLFTYTSDYFDLMIEYCEQLLKSGKAYVDDTEPELMKQEREQQKESVNRNNSTEKNFTMWSEMKAATEYGQKCCVRAKIDMSSANGCMRDPTIYRCKSEPHPRTGTKYKVYPTYDFACPIVDAIEGVTHTLRTMEYHDRDDQFYWFIEALGLRKPYIWEYSRLSMTNTVLSKRKLTWFVQEGLVDGWDDPRMPTVRGILRRGMTVEGLKQFIIAQGSSRSVVFMEWDKIWSFNKKVIDPIVPRFTALEYNNTVTVNVSNAKLESSLVQKHPKNPDVGMKTVWVGQKILIDYADAETLKEGENVTFINWGNLKIKKLHRINGKITSVDAETNLENKDYKKTLKLTWLCETDKSTFTPCFCVYYDHIISKPLLGKDEDFKQYVGHNTRTEVQMIGDPELRLLKEGDIIQLQRRGFYRVDVPYAPSDAYGCKEQPIIMISIPDGHTKESATTVKPSTLSVSSNQVQTTNFAGVINKTVPSLNSNDSVLLEKIAQQGDKVRTLKNQKAEKSQIDSEVKVLLDLKAEFKKVTGKDWTPNLKSNTATFSQTSSFTSGLDENILLEKIVQQGDKVRALKAQKAEKSQIDEEVKILLDLKAEYKKVIGKDWTPSMKPTTTVNVANTMDLDENALLEKIVQQGDKVRALKAQKAEKSQIDAAVKILLDLKAEFKKVTGKDWTPNMKPNTAVNIANTTDENSLLKKIAEQGNKVRTLKNQKAEKSQIDTEVKLLLNLKAEFKTITGKEWKPEMGSSVPLIIDYKNSNTENLSKKITEQGDKVRLLKAQKVEKNIIDSEVKILLDLKAEYKKVNGNDWKPDEKKLIKDKTSEIAEKNVNNKTTNKSVNIKKTSEKKIDEDIGNIKKQTRLGLEAKKNENLADWYSQVITKGELIEYYDVSGCYIYRPWSFSIWEMIRDWFDNEIKKLGVQNCYFPIFVSRAALEKEKTHIADFAPEVAWVTKSGDSTMAEPVAIRPTSETVMYPAYAKWIQSYRDLPIKLNQWNNVVRWEFKHPQPFLRTREFLWQEGHTAFAVKEEADEEVLKILDLYARVYTDLLAVPVIKGRKTEKEKFAGGDYTTTVEAFISASGRAIQGATSHHLGQNFSKMFEIVYEDPETQEKKYVYQNSWGITTRTIGVMIMIHSDDQGLVLPPNVASIQLIIVPCGITAALSDEGRNELIESCQLLEKQLKEIGVRVKGDYRDNYSPGWKFNHWELKGVPIRVELGPKDLKNNQIVAVRRDTGEKLVFKRSTAIKDIKFLLETIHKNLLDRATQDLNSHVVVSKKWNEFCNHLENKNLILAPFCGNVQCEDNIKADSTREDNESVEPGMPAMGAKSLCIPFEQPAVITSADKCIHSSCTKPPLFYTLFGRSY